MLLITLGTSQTSDHLVPLLLEQKTDFRLFVHSDSSMHTFKNKHEALKEDNFIVGDLSDVSSIRKALQGITKVVHIGPPFHVNEDGIGKTVIDQARAAGVKQFILISVLHPVLTRLLNHKIKMPIQEFLMEGDDYPMQWTILEPTCFMQNVRLDKVIETGTLPLGYDVDRLQGFVDRADLAEVITMVLREPEKHHRARYEIHSVNISHTQIAKIISEQSGKSIEAKKIGVDGFADMLKKAGVRPMLDHKYGEEAYKTMIFHYDSHGLTGNPNVLTWLLGREPTSWPAYVKKVLSK